MSLQIIDLSAGGWIKGDITNYFGSNVAHMYDHKPELLAKAPRFTGDPHGHAFGSAFIEGSRPQLHDFLLAFVDEYDDHGTVDTCRSLHYAIEQGAPVIRAYRHAWPGEFPPEIPESLMLARFAQVIVMEDRGAGWGHLIAERDSFRRYCLWEVEAFQIHENRIAMRHMNGFERVEHFATFGFDWHGQSVPEGDDLKRMWRHVEQTANRYDEKLHWFATAIANDPRLRND